MFSSMSQIILDRKQDRAAAAQLMRVFPVTATLGPRQAGKTTLAKTFTRSYEHVKAISFLRN